MLDFCKFFLDFSDVIAIGKQKFSFMFLDDMLHLLVHVIDGLVEVFIGLNHWHPAVVGDEGAFVQLHVVHNFIVNIHQKVTLGYSIKMTLQ